MNKKYSFAIAAFILPIVVYFWVILGWAVGEDCVAGVNGAVPGSITNYQYCQQQIDTGAYSWQHIPQWRLVAADWAKGIVPLWNPHQGIGVPLAANFISGAFNPILVLFNLPKNLVITHWYLVFRLSLASLGMYLSLRTLKQSRWASLAGGYLFVFNGYVTQLFSIHHHDVDFCLPWLLLVAILAKNNRRWWTVSSVLIALSIFAGMPETNVFVFGIYSLLILWQGWSLGKKERIWYYIQFVTFTILGIGISAILLLPGLEYISLAANSRNLDLGQIYSTSPKNIIFWILPRLVGPFHNILTRNPDLGVLNVDYFGIVAFMLVFVSLINQISFPGVLLIILISQYFGFIHLPLNLIPVVKDTIYIKYSLGVINFLAAIELAKGISIWPKIVSRKNIILLISMIILGCSLFIQKDLLKELGTNPIWKAKATLGFLFAQTFLAITLIIFTLKTKSEKWLALLVITELLLFLPWVGDRTRTMQINNSDFVQSLQKKNDNYRIFSPDAVLYPDYASFFGLYDIRNLDALWPKNYYQYLKEFIQPDIDMAVMRFASAKDTPDQQVASISGNPFFNQLSVKYLPQYRDGEIGITKNLDAFPRAYFVSDVICSEDVVKTLKNNQKNLRSIAVIYQNECRGKSSLPLGKINNISVGENIMSFDYESTTAGYLVITDNYYPGWIAKVNDRVVKIDEVNLTFRGLSVPANINGHIVIEYKPQSFSLGLKIFLFSIASVFILFFVLV